VAGRRVPVGVEGHGVVVVVKALLDALVMPPLIAWFRLRRWWRLRRCLGSLDALDRWLKVK
jgi:hypothetical protein